MMRPPSPVGEAAALGTPAGLPGAPARAGLQASVPPHLQLNEKQLTSAIKNATTAERLAQLAGHELNAIHIAAILTKLANISKAQSQLPASGLHASSVYAARAAQARVQVVDQLVALLKAQRCAGHCPRGLANIIWALGKLQSNPDIDLLTQLLANFCRQLPAAVPQDIANVLWGVAQITCDSSDDDTPMPFQQLLSPRPPPLASAQQRAAVAATAATAAAATAAAAPDAASSDAGASAVGGTPPPPPAAVTAAVAAAAAAATGTSADVAGGSSGDPCVAPPPPQHKLLDVQQVHMLLQQLCTMLPSAAPQTISNIACAISVLQQVHKWCMCGCMAQVRQLAEAFVAGLHEALPSHVQKVVRCVTQLGLACAGHAREAWVAWQPPLLARMLAHMVLQRKALKQFHVVSVLRDVSQLTCLLLPPEVAAELASSGSSSEQQQDGEGGADADAVRAAAVVVAALDQLLEPRGQGEPAADSGAARDPASSGGGSTGMPAAAAGAVEAAGSSGAVDEQAGSPVSLLVQSLVGSMFERLLLSDGPAASAGAAGGAGSADSSRSSSGSGSLAPSLVLSKLAPQLQELGLLQSFTTLRGLCMLGSGGSTGGNLQAPLLGRPHVMGPAAEYRGAPGPQLDAFGRPHMQQQQWQPPPGQAVRQQWWDARGQPQYAAQAAQQHQLAARMQLSSSGVPHHHIAGAGGPAHGAVGRMYVQQPHHRQAQQQYLAHMALHLQQQAAVPPPPPPPGPQGVRLPLLQGAAPDGRGLEACGEEAVLLSPFEDAAASASAVAAAGASGAPPDIASGASSSTMTSLSGAASGTAGTSSSVGSSAPSFPSVQASSSMVSVQGSGSVIAPASLHAGSWDGRGGMLLSGGGGGTAGHAMYAVDRPGLLPAAAQLSAPSASTPAGGAAVYATAHYGGAPAAAGSGLAAQQPRSSSGPGSYGGSAGGGGQLPQHAGYVPMPRPGSSHQQHAELVIHHHQQQQQQRMMDASVAGMLGSHALSHSAAGPFTDGLPPLSQAGAAEAAAAVQGGGNVQVGGRQARVPSAGMPVVVVQRDGQSLAYHSMPDGTLVPMQPASFQQQQQQQQQRPAHAGQLPQPSSQQQQQQRMYAVEHGQAPELAGFVQQQQQQAGLQQQQQQAGLQQQLMQQLQQQQQYGAPGVYGDMDGSMSLTLHGQAAQMQQLQQLQQLLPQQQQQQQPQQPQQQQLSGSPMYYVIQAPSPAGVADGSYGLLGGELQQLAAAAAAQQQQQQQQQQQMLPPQQRQQPQQQWQALDAGGGSGFVQLSGSVLGSDGSGGAGPMLLNQHGAAPQLLADLQAQQQQQVQVQQQAAAQQQPVYYVMPSGY